MKEFKAKKIGMSQLFAPSGEVLPVTKIRPEKWELLEGVEEGASVEVKGVSKGKGFAGVVKRYHFAGGPATHGQSDRLRAPGSIGSTTTPGRVYKGKKMAGHLGGAKVTVKGLKIALLDKGAKVVALSGPVPGPINSQILVRII